MTIANEWRQRLRGTVDERPTKAVHVEMLRIELDHLAIAALAAESRGQGTRSGALKASRILSFYGLFDSRCRNFNARQERARQLGLPSLLADGRLATLEAAIFGPDSAHGYPSRAAAILHGLDRTYVLRLTRTRLRPGASKAPGDVDPESYLFKLLDGPPSERSFGDMAALGMYFDPLNLILISWIGSETEYPAALRRVYDATGEFSEWAAVRGDFAARLAQLGA